MKSMESQNRNWISILGTISGIFLGAILIIATIGKVADPVLFVEQIREEGLEILFSANTVAVVALTWETLVGLALLLGIRNYWVLIPTTVLSAFFLFLTGKTYYQVLSGQREESYDCGCFGIFLQRTSTEAFWQDLFILVPPLVIMLLDRRALREPLPKWRSIFSIAGTVILAIFTIGWAGLPDTGSYSDVIPQGIEAESLLPTDQFAVFINGEEKPEAEIFGSDFILKFVILAPEFGSESIVVDIQKSSVASFDSASIIRNSDGSVMISDSEPIEDFGKFEIGPLGMSFDFRGKTVEMRSK